MVDDPTSPNYKPDVDVAPTAPGIGVEIPDAGPAVTPTLRATDSDMRPPSGPADVKATMLPEAGYRLNGLIGRGGMGEVMAATDTRIGRDVAIKRMRNPRPNKEAVTRFLREARIQARLDHPAIVPVHEINVAENRLYFTMKRCAGGTLAKLISEGQSLHKMLRVFIDVCHAIDFAHARGVVHRDLKPANIIVGDYGEVYVLDWGVARVLGDPDDEAAQSIQPHSETPDPEDSTKSGALLGTPGYIAPEQIEGEAPLPSADVYALGCILFEILTLEPLHPRGEPAIGRTLSSPQASPRDRRPERAIPPELDSACFDALANAARKRPTARGLADRVQAYLDGDRDLERRRMLASQQMDFARETFAAGDPEARVAALRAAGRALALDPECPGAAELVSVILLEPSKDMPKECGQSIDEHEKRISRDRSKKAVYAYLSIVALIPLLFFLEIKSWTVLIAFYGLVALGIGASLWHYRTGRPSVAVSLVVNLALVVLFSRVAGPFVLTPLVIAGLMFGLSQISWMNDRMWALFAWGAAAVMLPILLEATGVLPTTWAIHDGMMRIQSDVIRTHGVFEELCLIGTSLLFTLTVGWFALTVSRRRRRSQRALHVHAWHLRQLVPESRGWTTQLR